MNWTKTLITGVALAAAVTGFAHYSRAQVVQRLAAGPQSGLSPSRPAAQEPIYTFEMEHRGVRLDLYAVAWGLSGPGFVVDVWNDDPGAPELFDVGAAVGTVTIDAHSVPLVTYPPTAERPLGGRRAVIPPSWSTWPGLPWTGRDLAFELSDPQDPQRRIGASAENVRG